MIDKNTSVHLLPGGLKPLPPGRYITRGMGGLCWDQCNDVYVDFVCGYGPIVLGHCDERVNQAVIEQMNRGILFPSNSFERDKLVTVLGRIFPYADQSLFMKTGSEAIVAAIRLARAFTGRKKLSVVVFMVGMTHLYHPICLGIGMK